MIAFAALLDRLTLTPGRLAKIALLKTFFAQESDPDRGWALAALTGSLSFASAKAGLIRSVAEARVDPVLFRLSYDFVGDLAETVSLIWPQSGSVAPPGLTEIVRTLTEGRKVDLPEKLNAWLDASEPSVRYAILKLITGSLRVGASARLAKTALAEHAAGFGLQIAPDDIEEVWHALTPPYLPLFDWLEGKAEMPRALGLPVVMIDRPARPERARAASVAEVMAWLSTHPTDLGE